MPRLKDVEYTPDQKRVAEYIVKISNGQLGGGDDPVGFLIASHNMLRLELQQLRGGRDG